MAAPLAATVEVQVTSSRPSPQPVGTTVIWSAAGTTSNGGPVTYKFELQAPGSGSYSLLRDFSLVNVFAWTPSLVEGGYLIRVTARDYIAGETAQQVVQFQVTSLVAANQAAVSATTHPQVALFSAPTCAAGSSARVSYRKAGSAVVNYTPWRSCRPRSINFYVAGLYADSTYEMNYEVVTGSTVVAGPTPLNFATGSIPPLLFPPTNLLVPAGPGAALSYKIVLMAYFIQLDQPAFPVAYDLKGNILWYYPIYSQVTRPMTGGTMFLITDGPGTGTGYWGAALRQSTLREIDLAGNVLRETNVDRVNEQLVALGTDYIGRFHHEAVRLPSGNVVVFGSIQRAFPPGTQGSTDPVDIVGDMLIELDPNLQVVWFWNSFDHAGPTELDINRAAVRGEICTPDILGCPPGLLPRFTTANDWLHSNSLQYVPADGSLIVSMRNQDWVVKIDYNNGSGGGNVLWRLGLGGDFAMTGSSDPYPWFSGAHDAAFEGSGPQVLTIFDNGNSRVPHFPGPLSRGQALIVDEVNKVVSLALNADLGVYAPAFGSAQRLPNGNYMFEPGHISSGPDLYARSIEVNPSGVIVHSLQGRHASYRAFRMKDLYTAPSGQ